MNEIALWSTEEKWSSSRKEHAAENVEECPLLQSWEAVFCFVFLQVETEKQHQR